LSPVFIESLWKIVASILHLGNIKFESGANESVIRLLDEKPLVYAAELLELDPSLLEQLFLTRVTVVGKEVYTNPRRIKEVR
jgi:myosin heavy subunit